MGDARVLLEMLGSCGRCDGLVGDGRVLWEM